MSGHDFTQLAADTTGIWHPADAAGRVTSFAIDSRTLSSGDMFVALPTDKRDGHDFLAAAAARGATAALVTRVIPGVDLPQLLVADSLAALHALARAQRARLSGLVVGVTGSAGKTSTKDLLAVLLGETDTVLATEGNLNNHLGVPLTLLRLDAARHERAVIEAGISGPGEMDVIAPLIAPDIAIVTTVAAAHLDGLGTVEGVAVEKSRLIAHRREGGVAVFPASCLAYRAFQEISGPVIIALPAGTPFPPAPAGAQFVPFAARHQGFVTRLCITWRGVVEEFDLRRVTTGMAGNAALALMTALQVGVPVETLRTRLPRWRPAALRGEIRREGNRTIYLDCYNANPSSMADAVEAFVAMTDAKAPRLFVVGCMEELGTDSAALHRTTGRHWPLQAGDRLVVFGTQAEALAAGARSVAPRAEVQVNPDRAEAAQLVRSFSGAIFLKGSRRYALETLLVDGAGVGHGQEVAA